MDQQVVRGNSSEFTAASKTRYTIRETNGDDDAIISNAGGGQDGTSMNKWLAAIITHINGKAVKLTADEAAKIPSRDRFGILFQSRIFSLSPIIKFLHTCSNKRCEFTPTSEAPYEEDLNLYQWDFAKPAPKPGEAGYSKYRLVEYPFPVEQDKWLEHTLSSKKEIRFKYLDGEGENVLLDVPNEDLNKNFELLTHRLEWKNEIGKWQKVQRFNIFSGKEMAEIRGLIKRYDEAYDAICDVHCPKCKNIDRFNLLGSKDFFFPTEI